MGEKGANTPNLRAPIRSSSTRHAPTSPPSPQFCEAPPGAHGGGDHADDLLFFVLTDAAAAAAAPEDRLLVRRNVGGRPPPGLGLSEPDAPSIDWRASVLLNLAVQTPYALAVVACRRAALKDAGVPAALAAAARAAVAAGGRRRPAYAPPAGRGVAHAVYASPLRTAVDAPGARGGEGRRRRARSDDPPAAPTPCYPDVCFAVDPAGDEYDGAGDGALDLASPGDVFAVFLVATGGAALRASAAAATEAAASDTTPTPPPPTSHFVDMFSGFVSYEQLAGALSDAPPAPPPFARGGRGAPGDAPPNTHVRMRGPGGDGVADVAVSKLPSVPPAGVPDGGGGGGGGVKSVVAALAAALAPPPQPTGPPVFRCELFALSLPASVLAARLLGLAAVEEGG